ncbi:PLD nuclease N-terminal domain-containing protein [Rhodococcus tukisamuensis]|uniref:Phospholipase_D-nuclease N-terminal n=1 Tax=Rhodococcus tukisamuensis TaxID=168276 RepID=A0A1G7CYJ6_9NOCA|nr:PLD nuclease N-terminal domain-containing protein [Rhodococcus tukisamuensis]SDE44378.1 Phospholipase_D-nuclease N-terminal [Rhodococcus tukisamuensis]
MDDGTVNPTLPLAYDIAFTAVAVVWIALTTAALVSVSRSEPDRAGSRYWWCAVVVVLPFLGALAWFLFGAPRRQGARR